MTNAIGSTEAVASSLPSPVGLSPLPAVAVSSGTPETSDPADCNERWLKALPAARNVLALQFQSDGVAAAYQERHPGSCWQTVDLSGCSGPATLPEGRFDLIVLTDSLPWLSDPLALLRELAKRAAPQGKLMLRTTHHASVQWLRRWMDGDLSVEPCGGAALGQPRLMSVANIFKLLMDAGWMPNLVGAVNVEPLPEPARVALTHLRSSLGYGVGGSAERVQAMDTLFIEAKQSFSESARLPGPAQFDVLVPTNDERQLNVNVKASPGLLEVQARVISSRGASNPAEAISQGQSKVDRDWILICHQDIYFPTGFGEQLNAVLNSIPLRDRRHTLLGFVGMGFSAEKKAREPAGFVIDRLYRADHSDCDTAVSLDELAIVIARDSVHKIDPALGWHLWGTDLCLTAICHHSVFPRIVRLPLFHNSRTGWRLPAEFERSARTLAQKWAGWGHIHTLCGVIDAACSHV